MRNAANWKLGAILNGACLDVDHDEAEIRLVRVANKEGKDRMRAGYPPDYPIDLTEPGVSRTDLARQLEKEAMDKQQKLKAEGGRWNHDRMDIDAGSELID